MNTRPELSYTNFPKQESWCINTFQWSDLIVHEISERMQPRSRATRKRTMDNSERFIHWLTNVLLTVCDTKEVPTGHKLNALCVYMNQKNIEFLHLHIDKYVWLDISPKCCDELADNEFAIDPDVVIVMQEWPEIVSG